MAKRRNPSATIQWRKHKLKSGEITKTATLNWSDGGHQCRVSLGAIDPGEAEDYRLAKELELRTGAQVFSYSPLFKEMAEEYLAWRKHEFPNSQERIDQLVNLHLIPAFQYVALDAMSPRQVEKYKADRLATEYRKDQRVSEATVAKEVRTLKAIMNKAVEWNVIKFSPIKIVKPPKILTSRKIHWFEMEDLQALYKRSGTHGPIWQLMANTGIRRGEACQLTKSQDKGESILIESTRVARTKSGRWREIPLSVNGREALTALIEASRTDYVLPVMSPHSLTRAFNRDKGDLDGTLHSLRHTFGSHLAIKGTPIRVLQELMGHASTKTTEQYLQIAQKHLTQAIEGFSI